MSNLDTSQVESMSEIFGEDGSLANLDLTNFDTGQVTTMTKMFYEDKGLTKLNLSNFDTSNVHNMVFMFGNDTGLTSLDLSSFDNTQMELEELQQSSYLMEGMFSGLSLESLKLGEKFKFYNDSTYLDSPKATDGKETTGNWIKDDGTSKAYNPTDFMAKYGTDDLTAGTYVAEEEVPKWGTSPWKFDETTGVLTIEAGTLSTSKDSPWNRDDGYKIDGSAIKTINFDGKVVLSANSTQVFRSLRNLTGFSNITNLDLGQLTNMSQLFEDDISLKSVDLSNINTSQVTSMYGLFEDDTSLESVNLTNFDTSQVTNMAVMFSNGPKFKELDLSSFDTSKVTDIGGMLATQIESLKLGNKFQFKPKVSNGNSAGLKAAVSSDGSVTTGNWIKDDGSSKAYSPTDFMAKYGTDDLTAGTYVAEGLRWGTSPWKFDETTGVLTIEAGTLSTQSDSPWNRDDGYKIDGSAIKTINFDGKVVLSENSVQVFRNLTKLTGFNNITNLDLGQLTDMSHLFQGEISLQSIDLSSLNTSQVTNMYGLFEDDTSLESVNLTNFDTSQVTNMAVMFANGPKFKELDLSSFDTSKVISIGGMLGGVSIESLKLGDKFKFKSSNGEDAGLKDAVSSDGSVTTGNWIKDDGSSKAYSPTDFMAKYGTDDLTAGTYVAEGLRWGTSPYSFDEKTGVLTVEAGTLSAANGSFPWARKDGYSIDPTLIKTINIDGKVSAPSDSRALFGDLPNLITIENLSNLDTSQVENMTEMFSNDESLANLDLTNFDTGQVGDMSRMFYGDKSLTKLNLSNFDTSNVQNVVFMFGKDTGLTNLDLSSFDTTQIHDMELMFSGLSLESLKLGEKFKFNDDSADLGSPKATDGKETTGNWIKDDGTSKAYNPTDFMAKYGTDDLTAGTYVAELSKKSDLTLSATSDQPDLYYIGDTIITTLDIRHSSNSEEGSTAYNINISGLSGYTLDGAQELPESVTVGTYDDSNTLLETKDYPLTSDLSLPDLVKGNYYKIIIQGKAINNTTMGTKADIILSYSQDDKLPPKDITSRIGNFTILSGPLEFINVPDELEFENTTFSTDINNKLIGRKNNDWGMDVSDLRGTNPREDGEKVDRQNWNVYATSGVFKDQTGEEVLDNALSIVFANNGEDKELSSQETLIESHDVTGETPKDNSETTIKWDENEGIKAVVHDRSKLDPKKQYNSDLTFEIRLEP